MENTEGGGGGGGGGERGEEVLGSSLTMEKVKAAKKFIENHYRAQMKNIQERKERFCYGFSLSLSLFFFRVVVLCGFWLVLGGCVNCIVYCLDLV